MMMIVVLLPLNCQAKERYWPLTAYVCQSSDLVLRGQVLSVEQIPLERSPSTGIIASVGKKNTIRVERIYRGEVSANRLIVLTQGGLLPDNIVLTVEGEPVLVKGTKVVLFLKKRIYEPFYYEVFDRKNSFFIVRNDEEIQSLEKAMSRYLPGIM
jgi:hypothetical protein